MISLKCKQCGKFLMVKEVYDDVFRCPVCGYFMTSLEDESSVIETARILKRDQPAMGKFPDIDRDYLD